ncbi:MAG TPA: hypothetical protein VFY23_16445 [Candidatus Limnocylindrales bacterium]|nr:hypothetical protein [Candidatus Limnocylindrales bacterium]
MRRASLGIAAVIAVTAVTPALANDSGFSTDQAAMVAPVMAGVSVDPIITVGETLAGGYRFEAIPDGIALRTRGEGRVDVFVNHETSRVPFPYNTANPTAANSENDFNNSQVSRLVLNRHSGGVLSGSYPIDVDGGYQRFCSNYLATAAEGFDRDILLTNEEGLDYVRRDAAAWPVAIGSPEEEQIGVVVALDVRTGKSYPIYGMGRHNHENSVPLPGYDDLVVLSGDDTFTSGSLSDPTGTTNPLPPLAPSQSQLYSYIAADTDTLLADDGDLWAFVSDAPAMDDYYDFAPGSTASVSGHFIQVPRDIATGKAPDGSELTAADKGYPLPPNDGSWQRDLRTGNTVGLDGPQWVLEYWSQQNNVFNFVRVEDIAYDKRAGMGNVAYVVDSGRGSTGPSQAGRSTNGRVWKMVFDPEDPTVVTSLSIFVEGDDSPVKTLAEVHQPDNIETTATGVLLTEDPGSSQQFPVGSPDPNATTARLMYVPYTGGAAQTVLKADQSADGGLTDVDGKPLGNLGAWETSGIVDASAAFGEGAFLLNVQAHSLWVEKAPGEDNNGDGQPDFTYKREGGQLLLVRIPGI